MRWKNVQNYEGKYLINKIGQVRSLLTNRILGDRINTKGYLHVALYDDGVRKDLMIHRLVALHFKSPIQNKPIVNHINLNKKDNRVNNLEYTTCSENTRHYFKNRFKQYYR